MYAPARHFLAPLARIGLLAVSCMIFCSFSGTATAAIAAADHSSGYSGLVLAKIVPHWQPPPDPVPRTVHVRVHIDAQGRASSCAPTAPSGNPALDASLCAAVRAAGKFASPPYSLPIDIFLHFWTGRPGQANAQPDQTGQTDQAGQTGQSAQASASQAAAQQPAPRTKSQAATQQAAARQQPAAREKTREREDIYVNKAMERIRANIALPSDLASGQSCTVRVLVDKNGRVLDARLEKAAKHTSFDKAILQAVNKTARLEPTPDGSTQELALTFVLEMP